VKQNGAAAQLDLRLLYPSILYFRLVCPVRWALDVRLELGQEGKSPRKLPNPFAKISGHSAGLIFVIGEACEIHAWESSKLEARVGRDDTKKERARAEYLRELNSMFDICRWLLH
jgi:hypothetical protein